MKGKKSKKFSRNFGYDNQDSEYVKPRKNIKAKYISNNEKDENNKFNKKQKPIEEHKERKRKKQDRKHDKKKLKKDAKDFINIHPDLIAPKRKRNKIIRLNEHYARMSRNYIYIYTIKPTTHNRQNIQRCIENMVNHAIRKNRNCNIRIFPHHPIFYSGRGQFPLTSVDDAINSFYDRLDRVLQSAEEVEIEGIEFEITVIANPVATGNPILDQLHTKSIRRIQNQDTLCLGRAIVTALAYTDYFENKTESQKKHIKEGRQLQTKLTNELYNFSHVEIKQEGNNLDDVKIFEHHLNIRIIIYYGNTNESILYSGNEEFDKRIYLYYHDEHYDVITHIAPFLSSRLYCVNCLKGYTNQHSCKDGTINSRQILWSCRYCKKTYSMHYQKPETHECNVKQCFICYAQYDKTTEHKCYMKNNEGKFKKSDKYVFFDFEATQDTGYHEVNFCIAYDNLTKLIYRMGNGYIAYYNFKNNYNTETLNLSHITKDNICQYLCLVKTEHKPNKSVIEIFCEKFISREFIGYTFIAHYAKGYDNQPILNWLIMNQVKPIVITTGNKISLINIKELKIRFIDSINFTLCPLSAFPKTFGFEGNKGYFPHTFNTKANQNYAGEYPALKYYGYNEMSDYNKEVKNQPNPEKQKLKHWHGAVKDEQFDFQKEMFYYCLTDVLILVKGCLLYRDLFLKIKNIDPFQYLTIAQLCNEIFMSMINNNEIGIPKTDNFEDVYSMKSIQWLESISNTNRIQIQHAKKGGERLINCNGTRYKVDGFYYDKINKIQHCFEFNGCYFHGCTKCYSREEICKRNNKSMRELFNKQQEKENDIANAPGFQLHTIWECEFDKIKELRNFQLDPELNKIKPKDAFYGGRTEPIMLYWSKYNGQDNSKVKARYVDSPSATTISKGKYVDFVSLYPTVNKYCKYPIGHPAKILSPSVEQYLENDYFGIMKCKILPPKKLHLPVLPYKQEIGNAHKLLFGLCKTCMNRTNVKCNHYKQREFNKKYDYIHAVKHCNTCLNNRNQYCDHTDEERAIIGTWTTAEVNKALEKGYKLLKIYEVEHFEKTKTGLFEDYVNLFMKYKLEASGCECNPDLCSPDCKNDNNCETKLQYVTDNLSYNLDINKVKYNAGLRFIAKICLNSLWGYFGMRQDFAQKEYVYNYEQLCNIVFNDKYKEVCPYILSNDVWMLEYHTKEQWIKPHRKTNIYIALYTTTHARLMLYEILDILGERVMMMDTDSCIYIDDSSEDCQKIKNMVGNNLGQLTDETAPHYIEEFVSPGPKDYSLLLSNGIIKGKFKGFITNSSSDEITMNKKIKLVTNPNEPYELVKSTKFLLNKKHEIYTKEEIKMYDFEFNKRIPLYLENGNVASIPFGFTT